VSTKLEIFARLGMRLSFLDYRGFEALTFFDGSLTPQTTRELLPLGVAAERLVVPTAEAPPSFFFPPLLEMGSHLRVRKPEFAAPDSVFRRPLLFALVVECHRAPRSAPFNRSLVLPAR